MTKNLELMTTAEVAKHLDLSISWVRKAWTRGDLREAVKAPGLRGARMFLRSDVDKLKRRLESGSTTTDSAATGAGG